MKKEQIEKRIEEIERDAMKYICVNEFGDIQCGIIKVNKKIDLILEILKDKAD